MKTRNSFTNYLFVLISLNVQTSYAITALSKLKEIPRKTDINILLIMVKKLDTPKERDKNVGDLKRLLGSSFNSYFTSIENPLKARTPGNNSIVGNSLRSSPRMSFNLTKMKFYLRKENGKRKELGKKVTQKFQRWLWNLSRCPVRYRWVDIGEQMFPRYIKVGTCSRKKTCSFPAGMKCIESDWKVINVLLYHCISDNNINSVNPNCQWRPMNLDILTECKCGCSGLKVS